MANGTIINLKFDRMLDIWQAKKENFQFYETIDI